jgi:hypothetical protein
MFHTDAQHFAPGEMPADAYFASFLSTTACLQIDERDYQQDHWWEAPSDGFRSPEGAFKAVIWAIRHKDRAAFRKATDPKQAQDQRNFDAQEKLYFELMEPLELTSVPRIYEFDGLAVFFAGVRSREKTSFGSFVFAQEPDGSFAFLPSGSNKVTYEMLQYWFDTNWAPGAGKRPPRYCAAESIRRATHRIALFPAGGEKNWHPSRLFLTGVSFDKPGDHATLVAQINSTIAKMKSSLVAGRLEEFTRYMTPEGGRRLKQGFATADEDRRSRFKAGIAQLRPFFLFDASPLVVVYTKPLAGEYDVMYFTPGPDKRWVWTNSAYLTAIDKIFRVGPLYKSALLNQPFSNLAIK